MAITRRGRAEIEGNEEKRQKKGNGFQEEEDVKEEKENGNGSSSFSSAVFAKEYEAARVRRMRENAQRMKLLGILDIQKKLKKTATDVRPEKKKKSPAPKFVTSNDPPRRSSRLQNMPRVCYSEIRQPKEEKRVIPNSEIQIEEGSNPELYTEEHEKMLGDSKTPWTLFIDGYDEEGQPIYDKFLGKSCHQCRQRTLGRRTKCSYCKSITGQLCGDCLYMRYGENILEVNENPEWICPVCRGICNCDRCRRRNGWLPTGAIYKQVQKLGFKSVAHYLMRTHQQQIKVEESAYKESVVVSAMDSSSSANNEEKDGRIASAESHL